MTCYSPLKAYKSKEVHHKTGRQKIVFKRPEEGWIDIELQLPCGKCIGCRLDKKREWAMRCYHESTLYDRNAFITLTYDNENIPHNWGLNHRDFQLFMKRLRKQVDQPIRYFMCGEYGELGRPHYHAIIFGYNWSDRVLITEKPEKLYGSASLTETWKKGFTTIGEVNFQTASYVAGYVAKKLDGPRKYDNLLNLDEETGVLYEIQPEYAKMSRGRNGKGGIGKGWLDKWKTDAYPSDFVIINGKKQRPPRYYDQQLTEEELFSIKHERVKFIAEHPDDFSPERLAAKKAITLKQQKTQRKLQ